ncbi:MAG: hypothetical protein PVH05_13860 [Burkholderiales bacterium]|jgi:hypothetical protein
MNRFATIFLTTGALAFMPSDAYAQKVPWIVLPLIASPVVAIALAVIFGIVARSWLIALKNIALVIGWVVWFLAASEFPAPDLVIWASIAALGFHSLIMLWLIMLYAFRRARRRHEA